MSEAKLKRKSDLSATNFQMVHPLESQVHQYPIIGPLALFFYLIAFYYVISVLESERHFFFFTLVIIGFTEYLYARIGIQWSQFSHHYQRDLAVVITTLLLHGFSITLWGLHPQLELFQIMMIHLSFVLYVAMRSGRLVDQQLSLWILFDGLAHLTVVPFSNLFIRPKILWYSREQMKLARFKPLRWLAALMSVVALVIILIFATVQLSQLSPAFSSISDQLLLSISDIFRKLSQWETFLNYLCYFIISLPIGLWLTGLIFGSGLMNNPSDLKSNLQMFGQRFHIFPKFSAILLVTLLIALYTLFFVTAFSDLFVIMSLSQIEAVDASTIAVSGFWQFIRITLLNLVVIWLIQFFYDEEWVQTKWVRISIFALLLFSFIFAALASWKTLAIYVFHYGWTPMRLISSWFSLVMMMGTILLIVQQLKPFFNAYRWIILMVLTSFTALLYLYPLLLH